MRRFYARKKTSEAFCSLTAGQLVPKCMLAHLAGSAVIRNRLLAHCQRRTTATDIRGHWEFLLSRCKNPQSLCTYIDYIWDFLLWSLLYICNIATIDRSRYLFS